jgi:hypothetical protein
MACLTLVFTQSFGQKKVKQSINIEKLPIPTSSPIRLFYIQRSNNANVVIYDANMLKNNVLNPKDPVDTYWIKYAEDGKKHELTNVQRNLAYGLHTSTIKNEPGAYEGHFLAYRARKFKVKMDSDNHPIALFPINKKMQILEHVYVNVDNSGMMPSVNYVELFGKDVVTGTAVYEKFKP